MPRKRIEISPKNRKAVDNFTTHLKAEGIKNEKTRRVYRSACDIALDIIKKDYDKLTPSDIDTIFSNDRMKPSTKELYKMKFKKFLKFYKKDKLAEYIKINSKILYEPTKTDDDILSKIELNQLIDSADNLRDKALIELFITTGGRRKEIAYLKYKDIKITESIIWVTINKSKGKPRPIPIVANEDITTSIYPENLVNYYYSHPFKENGEHPFFYSIRKNRYGDFFNPNSINEIIKKIVKKTKEKYPTFNRKLTPHILRHTSATYDGHFLTEPNLRQKYGWRKNSYMPSIYCHLNEKQLGEHLVKLSGKTDEEIKKDSTCPKCKQQVNINEKICHHCNYILDRQLQLEETEKLRKEKLDIAKININWNEKLTKLKKSYKKDSEKIKKEYYRDKTKFEKEIQQLKEEIKMEKETLSNFEEHDHETHELIQDTMNMMPKKLKKEFWEYFKKAIKKDSEQRIEIAKKIHKTKPEINKQKPKLSKEQQAKWSKTMKERKLRLEKYIKKQQKHSRVKEQS